MGQRPAPSADALLQGPDYDMEVLAYGVLYNGTGWDRPRDGGVANIAAASGLGAELGVAPGEWSAVHNPTTATQATITKAAVAGARHVCKSITATVATGATAQTPITVYLRDGATGAGTIIWTGTLSAPANSAGVIAIAGLNIFGSVNTAMTLEFSAAGVAASLEAVALSGYDAS